MYHKKNQDVLWVNLKVLAQLQPNERLNTKSSLFSIEENSFWYPAFLWRFIRGDGRRDSIKMVDGLISDAYQLYQSLQEDSDKELLTEHLRRAISGIYALKKTYEKDVTTVSLIERLLDKIAGFIPLDNCNTYTSENESI